MNEDFETFLELKMISDHFFQDITIYFRDFWPHWKTITYTLYGIFLQQDDLCIKETLITWIF